MYGQNIHLNEAMHRTRYARDMLIRERMKSSRFLEYSQILTLLA